MIQFIVNSNQFLFLGKLLPFGVNKRFEKNLPRKRRFDKKSKPTINALKK